MKRLASILAAAAVTSSSIAADHLFEVGDEPSCSHGDLQAAVNEAVDLSPDSVEIRVTRGTDLVNPPLLIQGGKVELTGAWTACGSDRRIGTTGLFGDGESSVISIRDSSISGGFERAEVTLERMLISGGDSIQGGGIEVRDGSELVIVESEVVGNQADLAGGGIALVEGSHLETFDSRISGNVVRTALTGPRGGGVFCADQGRILFQSGTEIGNNIAQTDSATSFSRGGAVFAGGGCFVDLVGGVVVTQNRAVLGGGLYFAEGSGGGFFFDDALDFPAFEGNQISSFGEPALLPSGGAFYAESGVDVLTERFRGTRNGAVSPGENSRGGLFTLESEARLFQLDNEFTQGAPNGCPNEASCTKIEDNRSDSAPVGFLGPRASVDLDRALITGHRAPGESLIESASEARLQLTSSMVVGNDVDGIFRDSLPGRSVMNIAHNTFADNPGLRFIARPSGTGNEIRFVNNLVDGDATLDIVDIDLDNAFSVEQWICHVGTTGSDRPFDRQVLIDDPAFVDRVGLNYRLRADSPVIDVCPASGLPALPGIDRDFDGDVRPFDHASAPDTEFIGDAGADEATHEAETNTLTVDVFGPGRVTALDEAIDCPGICSADILSTVEFGLDAAPDPGFVTVWGGDCQGATGDRCELTMTDDRAVEVEFVFIEPALFANGFEAP